MSRPRDEPPDVPVDRPVDGAPLRLGEAAVALYDDLRLSSILARLMDESARLLSTAAGSVSLVDAAQDRYAKAAASGAACRLGETFPLSEGITGRVTESRRPVVLARYGDLPSGHLPLAHPAARGAVAAVPIWWRGEVLGVNVVFAGCDRSFSPREVDRLEVLSQIGAAGIAAAAADDPALAGVVTEVGAPAHRDPGTDATARRFLAAVEDALRRRGPVPRLRVVLLHHPDRLRLLLHDETGALAGGPVREQLEGAWSRVGPPPGSRLHVEQVPGWGVLVLADLPLPGAPSPSPLSPREHEVLQLLARGLTDPQVARALFLSPKTVEKHVGAVLRKTGTSSRTAAVVRALERGWLPPVGGS